MLDYCDERRIQEVNGKRVFSIEFNIWIRIQLEMNYRKWLSKTDFSLIIIYPKFLAYYGEHAYLLLLGGVHNIHLEGTVSPNFDYRS